MKNIDQHTYDDLIAEARQLREHLAEWAGQLPSEPYSTEAKNCDRAFGQADWIIRNLSEAKAANDQAFKSSIEEALHRVETGAATRMDAIVLRGALS